ncbi:MAG: carboxypeptidase regulatory-like domain-containing protein [Armatimonadetes bacterium]|nr:carboxypeptidase regulatory-like domain-containing protein [Armatimonadota bacterium]
MFLRRIFKGIPDVGPWVSVAELIAAVLTIAAILVGLNVVPNPFVRVASGTISGTVTDFATGKPVPESTVQIIDNASRMMVCESIPDANGNFTETVKPGAYTVKAVCDGYKPAAKSVSVLEDKRRVVRLAIKQRTEAEAQTDAPQPSTVPTTKIVTVPVAVKAENPSGAARSSQSAPQTPASSSSTSRQALAQEQYRLAKSYFEQGKLQEAEDACNAAVKYDPTDGKFWASLIRINLQRDNIAAAKDYATEGKRKVKVNKDVFQSAVLEIPE